MGTLMSIPCEFSCVSLYDIREINSSFAVGTLKVMYLGNNRNSSHFSKDAVEKALPSLRNVPIVCHWDDEAEEIGGHDIAVVSDNEGTLRIKNLTEPCGVVPDHAQFKFQVECDEDGNEHEYLIIDGVILWKRQDVYKYIVDELGGKVKHSMEINIIDKKKTEDGYLDITNFEFTALCLLGNCTPCFQGSELELFTTQNFKLKMEQMMLEIKESFNKVNTSVEVDIHPQECFTKGGEKVLEEKKELAVKYGIDIDSLDFSIDDLSIEEFETKLKEISQSSNNDGNLEDVLTQGDNFNLDSNIHNELERILGSEKVQKEWGECSRYYFVDFDNDIHEVFCWDSLDWLLYGFTYEIIGDAITINFESKKRKKFEIVDFIDENNTQQESPIQQVYEIIENKVNSNAELEAKYQAASEAITNMENEIKELRKFKEDTETAILKEEKEKVFAEFEDLIGIDEFENLKNNCDQMNVETIEEKCYAIRGRKMATAKFSTDHIVKNHKIKIEKTNIEKNLYGGLFEKYGVDNKTVRED